MKEKTHLKSSEKDRFQIIYLNGPSSSGKTTLAKRLQEKFEEPFLHIGIDKMIGLMPEKVNDWEGGHAPLGFSWKLSKDPHGHPIYELQAGPFAEKISKTFKEVVLTLAKCGHFIIIDDVAFGHSEVDAWRRCLKDFKVLWIGVKAPLAILEKREQKRGNRIAGSARAQFYKVHREVTYDLEIDTSRYSLKECASLIDCCIARGKISEREIGL